MSLSRNISIKMAKYLTKLLKGSFKSVPNSYEDMTKVVKQKIPNDAKFKSHIELFYSTDTYVKFVEKGLAPIDINKMQIRNQICFIMDATGSMSSYINGTKKEIKKFIESLRSDAEKDFNAKFGEQKDKFEFVFEVAVVAYRDFTDTIKFETLDFTTNISDVENFLGTIKALGGGDEPENVKGAFIHALFGIDNNVKSLSWNDHGDVASRTVMWLADSPPHGIQFYGKIGDTYPSDGCNWDMIFDMMKSLKIGFYIARLNANNDVSHKHFQKINEEYKIPLEIVDISQSVVVEHGGSSFSSAAAYDKLTKSVSVNISGGSSEYVERNIGSKKFYI